MSIRKVRTDMTTKRRGEKDEKKIMENVAEMVEVKHTTQPDMLDCLCLLFG